MINTISEIFEAEDEEGGGIESKNASLSEELYNSQQLKELYKPLDDLILNSPFYKKFLKADVPYKTNEKKEKIVEVFKETFTSAELDSTMEILEKRIDLSNKTSLINRRVYESLSKYEEKTGGLKYGLAKRRRIASRTKDLMDSLVHAQTIGSSRVRKTLSGINKWVNSHDEDEDPLKKDNEDYDSDNSEPETMDEEDIEISEREVKVLLRDISNKRRSLKSSFDEAVNALNEMWEKRLFDANQKKLVAEKKTKMAKIEIKEKVTELRAKKQKIEDLNLEIRDWKFKLKLSSKEVLTLKFDVKRAKQETERLREMQRKQSADGMSIEDMSELITTLELWKKDNEVLSQQLKAERDGAMRTAEVLETQVMELRNRLEKLKEIDEKEDLNYDTDGNTISEEMVRQKRKYERKMMVQREEFELRLQTLDLKEKQLKNMQQKEIENLNEQQFKVIANLKQGQIRLEQKFLEKIEIMEADNRKVLQSFEEKIIQINTNNQKERSELQKIQVRDIRNLKDAYELKIKQIIQQNEEDTKGHRQQILLMKAHVDEVRDKAQRKITETVQNMAAHFEQERKEYVDLFTRDKERYKQQVLDATKTQRESYLRVLENHQKQIEQIRKEYDDKVVAREASFDTKILKLEKVFETKYIKLIEEHENGKQRWKNEAGKELLKQIETLQSSTASNIMKEEALLKKVNCMEEQLDNLNGHNKNLKINLQNKIDETNGLYHQMKSLQIKLNEIKNKYEDLKFEHNKDDRKSIILQEDYIHRDQVEKLISELVQKIDLLEQEKSEDIKKETNPAYENKNIEGFGGSKFLFKRRTRQSNDITLTEIIDKLTMHYKQCELLAQDVLKIKEKVLAKQAIITNDDWNSRFFKLEQTIRKTIQWCLMSVTIFRSNLLDSSSVLTKSMIMNNSINNNSTIRSMGNYSNNFSSAIPPSRMHNLKKLVSPKKRFIVQGYRHSGAMTLSPKISREHLSELGPYKGRSLPANSKILKNKNNEQSAKRKNENNEFLLMLASENYAQNKHDKQISTQPVLNEISMVIPSSPLRNYQHHDQHHQQHHAHAISNQQQHIGNIITNQNQNQEIQLTSPIIVSKHKVLGYKLANPPKLLIKGNNKTR